MALVPVMISFSEIFLINRIVSFEGKGLTEKVCCFKKINKDDWKQDTCPETVMSHRMLAMFWNISCAKTFFFFIRVKIVHGRNFSLEENEYCVT